MNFRRVNDRKVETEGRDGIKDREVVGGSRFTGDESKVYGERRDDIKKVVDTGMVIREEIENGDGGCIYILILFYLIISNISFSIL